MATDLSYVDDRLLNGRDGTCNWRGHQGGGLSVERRRLAALAGVERRVGIGQVVALLELFQFLARASQFSQQPLGVAVVHLLMVRRPIAATQFERVLVQFDLLFQAEHEPTAKRR